MIGKITVYRNGSREKEVLVKGTNDGNQLELTLPLTKEEDSEINYNDNGINSQDCCDNPYIVMEAGCETCKSCAWSACIIA